MEAGEAPRWLGEEHKAKAAYNGIEARLGKAERLSILDRDGRVRRLAQTLTCLFNHLLRDIGGQHRSTWGDGIKRRLGGDASPCRHIKHAMTGCKPRRTKHEWKEMG